LGDLLLQVIFQAPIGREKGDFDLVDVLSGISEKLIRRHPHVFADTEVENVDEIISNWEKIKDSEKENNCEEKNLLLGDISQANPALIQSFEVQEKAAEVGFDWDNIYGVLDKIEEEIDEVREAIKEKKENHLKEEIGDLLFSIVNLARFEGINPEQALLFSLNKFKNRFKYMENSLTKEGSCFEEQSLELLEEYWERAKKEMEGKN
ncbi:MAG: nucleoside triphosphate pyrophosphohydrolase, partial [Bacillota bacterium]